jgi:hypothetical protein
MDSILARFFLQHNQHDAWWYKLKIKPKAPTNSTHDALSPTDECPGEYSISKLLGITMQELWEVLIDCNLAKQMGKRGNILDKGAIKSFITNNRLDDFVALEKKDNQPVLRIGIYTINSTHQDHNATLQWKSQKKPPRPLRTAMLEFRKNLDKYNMENKKSPLLVSNTAKPAKNTLPHSGTTTAPLSPKIVFDDPLLKVGVKDFFSTQDATNDPSFL